MTAVAGFDVHPAAELFPLMEGAEFDALVKDIGENGQMDPIVVDAAGQLLDGRNRARACERLGIEPTQKVHHGNDVVRYVVSHNLYRRHLTDSQRSMIAAKLATRPKGWPIASDEAMPTQDETAALFNVSRASVQRSRVVVKDGTDGLQALVAEGLAPVLTAARVATEMSPDEQDDYVEKVRDGADPITVAPAAPKNPRRSSKTSPPRSDWHYRSPHIDATRIVEETISTLEGLAMGLALIDDVPSLDTAKRLEWLNALRQPLAAINRFKKELSS